MSGGLTEREAFEAMRWFMHQFAERGGWQPIDPVDLLNWTGNGAWADGSTNDPAQWFDWLSAVERARAGERFEFPEK